MDWRTSINNNYEYLFRRARYGLYRIHIIYEVERTSGKEKWIRVGSEGRKEEIYSWRFLVRKDGERWFDSWQLILWILRRELKQFVKHGIKSLIKMFRGRGKRKVFQRGMMRRETKRKKKRKKKEMEYIINEIFQDLFKLNSKWISSSFETF